MRPWYRLFFLFIVSITVTRAAAAPIPPVTIAFSRTNPANGHIYYLLRGANSSDGISWDDAEAAAVAFGGHLAAINDSAENSWILQNFPGGTLGYLDYYVWIGLNDPLRRGHFVWSNGDPLTFTQWYPGEPNNYLGMEHDVVIYNFPDGEFRWNDAVGNALYGTYPCSAIAEVAPVPEPTSVVLALLGSIALGSMLVAPRTRSVK
jgi:hypothetical protein